MDERNHNCLMVCVDYVESKNSICMLIYESKEKFELWDFMDGHRTLILRGGTGGLTTFNYVEIESLDVFYLNIPTSLHGICLDKMSDEEAQHLLMWIHKRGTHDNFFGIKSEGGQFVIGALSVSVYYTKVSGILPSVRSGDIKMSDIEIIVRSVDLK